MDAFMRVQEVKSGDCGLRDGSKAGDWRLPTKEEWEAMVKKGCDPAFSDNAGTGCYSSGTSLFKNMKTDIISYYWASTEIDARFAWAALFALGGSVEGWDRMNIGYMWPVRDPQPGEMEPFKK